MGRDRKWTPKFTVALGLTEHERRKAALQALADQYTKGNLSELLQEIADGLILLRPVSIKTRTKKMREAAATSGALRAG